MVDFIANLNCSEKGNNFKKFEYSDDDDEIFDLDDLFSEFHGNTFDFGVFPPGILKQFQDVLRAMQDFDEQPDNGQKQKLFENKYNEFRQKTDKDLDGQLYAEQLDTLLKRISPNLMPKTVAPPQKKKLLDEEKIMDIIHGTYREEVVPVKPRKRQVQKVPASAAPHHFGGLPPFDFPSSSPAGRTWAKTVVSIRKADGSSETRKMERAADGQTTTTITKTNADGISSTSVITGDEKKNPAISTHVPPSGNHEERNLTMFDGYKIPCLW